MNLLKTFVTIFCCVNLNTPSFAEDKGHDDHTDHADEEKSAHKGEHEGDQHEEENTKIGTDKGILKADKNLGFILSPEAIKNFGIKTIKVTGSSMGKVPFNARVLSKEEVNLFRMRNGFIKRIDFVKLSTVGDFMRIQSSELANGDELITDGVGFVRIAEITAFGGAAEGHSH